jgi:hypothetical protein
MRVYNAPLCCKELRAVPVAEIEYAERLLMEGVNYEFRCHHISSIIETIFSDFAVVLSRPNKIRGRGDFSPRASVDYHDDNTFLWQKAQDVAQRALIFSDAPFLFNPCHTAFAVTAIVMGSVTSEGNMGDKLQKYLTKRFPSKTKSDLHAFSESVRVIIQMLVDCPSMDLRPTCGRAGEIVAERADELRRILGEVATRRLLRKMKRCQSLPCDTRKRSRFELDFTPPRQLQARKYAKITPTGPRSGRC